jgi:BTB/POZ domain-containing protein KCTD9
MAALAGRSVELVAGPKENHLVYCAPSAAPKALAGITGSSRMTSFAVLSRRRGFISWLACAGVVAGCARTGGMMQTSRLDYEESCRQLQKLGYLEPGQLPPMPERLPRYDDESLGIEFFRTAVGAAVLADLTLPRTFFGRSEFRGTVFRNTDLSESNLCWNDFIEVDFSAAVLARGDLRASKFYAARFAAADLRGSDMRRSSFQDCLFTDSRLEGAILTRTQAAQMNISAAQHAQVDWRDDDGPEPGGG